MAKQCHAGIDSGPFPDLIVCGEGELIKTSLLPSQAPTAEEIR